MICEYLCGLKANKLDFEKLVLFENKDYLLVNKPAFLSTLEDRNERINLLQQVRQLEPAAQVGHRLDKDTTGVLAVARHPEAYRHLSLQFEKRLVKKVYHAVVDGVHHFEAKTVRSPILAKNDGTVKIDRGGKAAETHFRTLQWFTYHTLVQCEPVTGRMHQIRIHLATQKAPICGDEVYGGKPFYLSRIKRKFNLKRDSEEQPFMKRMALHAFSLAFTGLSGEPIEVNAPYPKDFEALLRQLTLHT